MKTISWKCKLGFHKWSVWSEIKLRISVDLLIHWGEDGVYYTDGMKKYCLNCGKTKIKQL